jgi:hypothetical protein
MPKANAASRCINSGYPYPPHAANAAKPATDKQDTAAPRQRVNFRDWRQPWAPASIDPPGREQVRDAVTSKATNRPERSADKPAAVTIGNDRPNTRTVAKVWARIPRELRHG